MDIRDRIIELRRVPACDLEPHPDNWRRHPKGQRRGLRAVLEEIGFADALLAREDNGHLEVIDGHLRREEMGAAEVPVLVTDLTEEEARKMLATLDPLAAMAEADTEQLGALLKSLEAGSEEMRALMEGLAKEHGVNMGDEPPEDPGPQSDRAAELQAEWKTELGQLWEIPGKAGVHRVLCGDSTKAEDVGRCLGGAEPFLMVTDPPYGVQLDQGWRDRIGINRLGRAQSDTIHQDDGFGWLSALSMAEPDVAYVWHAGIYAPVIHEALLEATFEIRQQIIWAKTMAPLSRGAYHWKHEPCWYAVRKGCSAQWCGDRTQVTLWEIASPKHIMGGSDEKKEDHPTQKPLECMARPIRNHGAEGDGVYDPFLGSGTTLVACEQLGRIGYGIEIEPKYVAVTLQRLKDMGLEPRLVGEGVKQ